MAAPCSPGWVEADDEQGDKMCGASNGDERSEKNDGDEESGLLAQVYKPRYPGGRGSMSPNSNPSEGDSLKMRSKIKAGSQSIHRTLAQHG